ncbi:hypothetical protein CEXT_634101 [Caerostris extrusa]|uniref:Uncharacterized protein n=1 Tax=Caerostris extrusa TaxID=172846 RepID=A0AAV4RI27_CAEEX|nr:hypothetical protein CEXT_634101 [Caerostris extrusa]
MRIKSISLRDCCERKLEGDIPSIWNDQFSLPDNSLIDSPPDTLIDSPPDTLIDNPPSTLLTPLDKLVRNSRLVARVLVQIIHPVFLPTWYYGRILSHHTYSCHVARVLQHERFLSECGLSFVDVSVRNLFGERN